MSARVSSLEVESPPLCSTPSTVSSRLLTEFLLASFPSSMSAVSKSSSAPSTISNVKKRLVLDDVDHQAKTKPKKQEPKFTPLTVSSRSSTEFLSMSSPSSMSAVSKPSSVPSTISNVNKRLVLDDVDHRAKTKPKKQEPKLAAYDIDWFDSSAIKNKCLKYTHITNLPDTQEGQITFLLSKFETSVIKTAFADAIGKVGKAARTVFYPLPPRKEKLIKGFLELISGKNSIMVDHSKDSFR